MKDQFPHKPDESSKLSRLQKAIEEYQAIGQQATKVDQDAIIHNYNDLETELRSFFLQKSPKPEDKPFKLPPPKKPQAKALSDPGETGTPLPRKPSKTPLPPPSPHKKNANPAHSEDLTQQLATRVSASSTPSLPSAKLPPNGSTTGRSETLPAPSAPLTNTQTPVESVTNRPTDETSPKQAETTSASLPTNPKNEYSKGKFPLPAPSPPPDRPTAPSPTSSRSEVSLSETVIKKPEDIVQSSEQASKGKAARASATELPSGTRIGNYEIVQVLGIGGFAIVYLAKQLAMNNRLVALKMLRAHTSARDVDIQRFLGEAEKAGKLQHPNIVRVFDRGRDGHTNFFVMEYVNGRTLADVIRAGTQTSERTLRYTELVARAIHAAHQQSILHRDLKPANILINQADQPIITDFGLARQIDDQTHNTKTGDILGTPAYMSPEQASGDMNRTDARSDIYSIGVILYELLTGKKPFAGTVHELLESHKTTEPTPLRRVDPKIPRDLETICLKCLQKNPRERYLTAQELADDIARFCRGEPIVARRLGIMQIAVRWCGRYPAFAGAVALTIVALLVASTLLLKLRTANNNQIEEVVNSLIHADIKKVPEILSKVQALGPSGQLSLRDRYAKPIKPTERTRIQLGLLSSDTAMVFPLRDSMLNADLDEFMVILKAIAPQKRRLIEGLWKAATAPDAKQGTRERALCALAFYDPLHFAWDANLSHFIEYLLSLGEESARWISPSKTFHPILLKSICEAFQAETVPARKTTAALLAIECSGEHREKLAELIVDADPPQFDLLIRPVCELRDLAHPILTRMSMSAEFAETSESDQSPLLLPTSLEDPVSAHRRSKAAVALSFLGDHSHIWRILRHQRFPKDRSFLIHDLSSMKIDAQLLASRLKESPAVPQEESDNQEKRAIILALGQYNTTQMEATTRSTVVALLLEEYGNCRDVGTLSAINWTLRQYGENAFSVHVHNPQHEVAPAPDQGNWYVNPLGDVMAVFSPTTFEMGETQGGRSPAAKSESLGQRHYRRISRRFSVSCTEATQEQFDKFRIENGVLVEANQADLNHPGGIPVVRVSWNEAAQFCRWLDKLEGLPESESCYMPPNDDGSCVPYPDALLRKGYRLPTNAEWEFVCGGGSEIKAFSGIDDSVLQYYAWTIENSAKRIWPVASLKPNDFGMFDVFGNASELCHDFHGSPRAHLDMVFINKVAALEDVGGGETGESRSCRGGAFNRPQYELNAAVAVPVQSSTWKDAATGFRVAKTLEIDRSTIGQASSVPFLSDEEQLYDASQFTTLAQISLSSFKQLAGRIALLFDIAGHSNSKSFYLQRLKAAVSDADLLASRRLSAVLQSNGTSHLLTPFMEFDSEQQASEALRPFFPLQEKGVDGIFRFYGSFTTFFRYQEGFGILADTRSQLLPDYLLDPRKQVVANDPQYDAFIGAKLNEIQRLYGDAIAAAGFADAFGEIDRLTAGLKVSTEERNAVIEVELVARPGSSLSASLSSWKGTASRFSHLRNAEFSDRVALTLELDLWMKTQLLKLVRLPTADTQLDLGVISKWFAEILPDPRHHKILVEVTEQLIQDGILDFVTIRDTASMTRVSALHTKQSRKLENLVHEVVVANLGEGAAAKTIRGNWNIYQLIAPNSTEPFASIAFSHDCVIFITGSVTPQSLNEILDSVLPSDGPQGQPVAPMLFELHLGKQKREFDAKLLQQFPKVPECFAMSLKDKDQIRVIIKPEDGSLRCQCEFQEDILRLAGNLLNYAMQLMYGLPSEKTEGP